MTDLCGETRIAERASSSRPGPTEDDSVYGNGISQSKSRTEAEREPKKRRWRRGERGKTNEENREDADILAPASSHSSSSVMDAANEPENKRGPFSSPPSFDATEDPQLSPWDNLRDDHDPRSNINVVTAATVTSPRLHLSLADFVSDNISSSGTTPVMAEGRCLDDGERRGDQHQTDIISVAATLGTTTLEVVGEGGVRDTFDFDSPKGKNKTTLSVSSCSSSSTPEESGEISTDPPAPAQKGVPAASAQAAPPALPPAARAAHVAVPVHSWSGAGETLARRVESLSTTAIGETDEDQLLWRERSKNEPQPAGPGVSEDGPPSLDMEVSRDISFGGIQRYTSGGPPGHVSIPGPTTPVVNVPQPVQTIHDPSTSASETVLSEDVAVPVHDSSGRAESDDVRVPRADEKCALREKMRFPLPAHPSHDKASAKFVEHLNNSLRSENLKIAPDLVVGAPSAREYWRWKSDDPVLEDAVTTLTIDGGFMDKKCRKMWSGVLLEDDLVEDEDGKPHFSCVDLAWRAAEAFGCLSKEDKNGVCERIWYLVRGYLPVNVRTLPGSRAPTSSTEEAIFRTDRTEDAIRKGLADLVLEVCAVTNSVRFIWCLRVVENRQRLTLLDIVTGYSTGVDKIERCADRFAKNCDIDTLRKCLERKCIHVSMAPRTTLSNKASGPKSSPPPTKKSSSSNKSAESYQTPFCFAPRSYEEPEPDDAAAVVKGHSREAYLPDPGEADSTGIALSDEQRSMCLAPEPMFGQGRAGGGKTLVEGLAAGRLWLKGRMSLTQRTLISHMDIASRLSRYW